MIVLDGIVERQKVLVPIGGNNDEAALERVAGFGVSNQSSCGEGSAVYDTFNPDRIVLGSNNPKAITMMKELYPNWERKVAADPFYHRCR